MDEAQMRKTIAGNITYYRKNAGLTQSELAQKLSYSDKSISKWERAEGTPDVFVLSRIAQLFGITVNDLLSETPVRPRFVRISTGRRIIPLLAVGLVWLIAATAYFAVEMLTSDLARSWVLFVYALPVSFIVLIVFTCMWWKTVARALSVSGLIWSLFLSLRLTFSSEKISLLLIIASILQILTVLWFYMRHHSGKHGNSQSDENN